MAEAFEELNGSYSAGGHVHTVGPVVQTVRMAPEQREAIRSEIAARFGIGFRHLAVTMLGGGVAADRSAQTSAICAMMAGRPDTLHLVVVWPTATVEAGAFAWPGLTTIEKPARALGRRAIDGLFDEIAGRADHGRIYLPCRLVERGSLADLTAAAEARTREPV